MHELPDAGCYAAPARTQQTLAIRFTGSGSEYFRIWIVNLLLTLLTLSLYLPFAKVRRLRYFYANTRIGDQALCFHGRPWPMFRGYLLLLTLAGAYGLAGHFSPLAGLIAYLLLCAIWPALWRAGMQFRMGNTRWRGLRLRFDGDLIGAYQAVAPIYLPGILVMVGAFISGPDHASEDLGVGGTVLFAGMGLMVLLAPYFMASIKRYQHGGYGYADQRATLDVGVGRFYMLVLKGLLVSLLPMVVAGALAAGLVALVQPSKQLMPVAIGFGVLLGYLLYFMMIGPYFAARLQNLVWNGTRSERLQFTSQLKFRSLLILTVCNWLLTALTLSLYRPFAAIKTARLRLEAINLVVGGDVETWQAQLSAEANDASGDAAGDFFGLDMGL